MRVGDIDMKKTFEGRGCTDIICLAAFFAGIGAMIFGTFYGF